ncbi:MAG: 30S ribosomal protein S21 [Saprospiraceae bacterium]|nr:30S ribosomal protein S21 [Saprospiraceae bacterium]
MIIIEVKEGERIDKAIKRYRRKHRRIGLRKELQRRKFYTKPSEARRNEILDAIYRNEKEMTEEI